MTALFLMSPAYGHLNRSFLVARQLQQQGYSIVYGHFGQQELAQLIQQQGFRLHWMQTVPFGVGMDEFLHQGKPESYLETLLDHLTKRTFYTRTAELTATLSALRPSLLLLDAFMSTDFIILYPFLAGSQTKLVILQNMLSTYNDGLTPPLNSTLVPGIDSAKAIQNVWRQQYRSRLKNDFLQRVKYVGYSRMSLIRWAFNRNKLPEKYRLRTDKVFHVGFDNVPEWIAAPAVFDFPERRLLPFQRHLNTSVDSERVEDVPPAYRTIIDRIRQERQTDPAIKLIYVSLGTAQQAKKQGTEERFFHSLIAIAQTQPNWRMVLAVRSELVNKFSTYPPNVFLFARVPQLHVLQQADLFITHGGLNSVLEAILHEVPMLVYPLNDKWDLPGYAARVVSHGVGLLGDLVHDDPTTITDRIQQLLNNAPVKDRLVRLRQLLIATTSLPLSID